MQNKIKKQDSLNPFKYLLSLISIFTLYLFFKIPTFLIKFIINVSAWLLWIFGFSLKKQAMENLRLVYGNKYPKNEIERIAKASLKQIIRMFMECGCFVRPPFVNLKEIPIEGEEHLKAAIGSGKGVLAVGSHVGNFMALLCSLSLKGYPISFIYKEPKDERLKNYIRKLQDGIKLKVIPVKPRKTAAKRSQSTLENSEILWVALDQATRGRAMGVEFFGVKATMPIGPAELIIKTGAAVLPMYMKLNGWMDHTIVIRKPLEVDLTFDDERDVYNILKNINEDMEEIILENPEEWWWVHKRWKKFRRYGNETDVVDI